MDFQYKSKYDVNDLIKIMELLRGENGCPWDREQTHKSIRKNFIEETYEVCEAIDTDDTELLREELGDVLLQVVFHSCMEQEAGRFDFSDVANDICQKLIVRHPHVFSDTQVNSTEQVLSNWEKIKREGKGQKTYTESLKSVCAALPALMRAEKVQQRAAKAGFDYPDAAMAFSDLDSEVTELREAMCEQDAEHIVEELGDLMFAAVNVARFTKNDAEYVLSKATDKFIRRFEAVEELAEQQNIDMHSADIDSLNELWKQAKNK